jgi:uncharacterized membrane protein
MYDRPKIKIKKSKLEMIMNGLSVLMIAGTIIYIASVWPELPDKMPSHFNAAGEPDDWSGKGSVLILPIISSLMFMLLYFVAKFPHIHNYPVKVTEENAERLYTISNRMLVILNFEMVFFLNLGAWETVKVGFGKDGLGLWFLPSLIGVTLVTIIIALIKISKVK